jgi:MFS family permease
MRTGRLHPHAGKPIVYSVTSSYTSVDIHQVPSNIFLAQLRPSIYLPVCMASWGIVSTCTGAVQSAAGLYAARFFLGFVEACFYPGCIFLLSSWYRRSELSLRCAILYAGSQVGSAFSGLIAAGITSGLDGALGMRAWRWIFVSGIHKTTSS